MRKTSERIRNLISERQDFLATEVTNRQWKRRADLKLRYGKQGHSKCLEDARYHLRYLAEAVGAEETALFTDYVAWAKVMLNSRNIPPEDLVSNLEVLRDVLRDNLPDRFAKIVVSYIDTGLQRLSDVTLVQPTFLDDGQPLADLAKRYLSALLRYERHIAATMIMEAVKSKISVKEIYFHVFERCQHEIGRLWQSNMVSVAQEHYCNAATQLVMSQLFPYIFRSDKKSNSTIVAACVSGELHELGARMLCDFLEMEGWNTIYLGANVPTAGIVDVLRKTNSNVLAISASMTYHIAAVRDVIVAVRSVVPKAKILVGGYAFRVAPSLWKDVGADHSPKDASEAIILLKKIEDAIPSL